MAKNNLNIFYCANSFLKFFIRVRKFRAGPEIDYLDYRVLALRIEDNILWFKVPVDDTFPVAVHYCRDDLFHITGHIFFRQLLHLPDLLEQLSPVTILGH